jgi:hypothetical protein
VWVISVTIITTVYWLKLREAFQKFQNYHTGPRITRVWDRCDRRSIWIHARWGDIRLKVRLHSAVDTGIVSTQNRSVLVDTQNVLALRLTRVSVISRTPLKQSCIYLFFYFTSAKSILSHQLSISKYRANLIKLSYFIFQEKSLQDFTLFSILIKHCFPFTS